ncbi:endoribonuclease L-PSP [Colletotrichum plurivorum]|uniref:Endoribonuclease L-PSP n=1 Tax=Colletotrichum plurivorum TaxID=2175906 RepID=A0A8H6NEL0_9PEZI|nr:endoribonuclease L-PSP [Colletotrichum plurivorum]
MTPTRLPQIERTTIAGSIEIPRMLNGLWQLAGGHDQDVDVAAAAANMSPLIDAGLDGFDVADHYGPAELVIGHHRLSSPRRPVVAFTKWCPAESDGSFATAEKAVDLARRRTGGEKIEVMQFHAWDYSDPVWLRNIAHLQALQRAGKINKIGVTNFDAAHLEMLLDSGVDVVTNQVSLSVIDRRVLTGRMGKVCKERGVGVLAYGTLLGGFLGEKWVGAAEPAESEEMNWSLRKYLRFIRAAGGWDAFQKVLSVLREVAKKHEVSIAAVATRWVLDGPVVKAVIVGRRLSEDSGRYMEKNMATFGIQLDGEDRAAIKAAQEGLRDVPGDCGDEYRRAPFLTASGDLRDHIREGDQMRRVEEAVAEGIRVEVSSGSKWESVCGYSRAVRVGDVIRVSGTTATPPPGLEMKVVGGTSARSQAVAALDIIEGSLKRLGGGMADVVRTRVMLRREEDVGAVSEVHGWVFGCHGVRPANTTTTVGLIGEEVLVEIEAEAVVGSGTSVVRM